MNVSVQELIPENDADKDGENCHAEELLETGKNRWMARERIRISNRKLKIIMARQMMTTESLTERAGISRQRLYDIRKSKNIRPETANRIAKVLGVDVTEILEDEECMTERTYMERDMRMDNEKVEKMLNDMQKCCSQHRSFCKHFFSDKSCTDCRRAVQIAEAALEKMDCEEGLEQENENLGKTELICNSEGKWKRYDDKYDIIIRCKDEKEQKKAKEALMASHTWIPIGERVPEDDRYILLSFANCSLPAIGRYKGDEGGGAFYEGDSEKSCKSYGIYVNAWMELPEPYGEEEGTWGD